MAKPRKITEMKLFQYKILERISVQLAFQREFWFSICYLLSESFIKFYVSKTNSDYDKLIL